MSADCTSWYILDKVVNFTQMGQFFVYRSTIHCIQVQPVRPIKIYQNLTLDGSIIYNWIVYLRGWRGQVRRVI